MNLWRYGLMLLLMVGYTSDQLASSGGASVYRIGQLQPSGKRDVHAPSGRVYHVPSGDFDEAGQLKPRVLERLDQQESRLRSVPAGAQAAQGAPVAQPGVLGLRQQPTSSTVAAAGRGARVHFAPTTNVGDPVVDKTFTGQYQGHAGSSAKGEKFGPDISLSGAARIDRMRQAQAANSWSRYDEADLYVEDAELGRVDAILDDLSRIWVDDFGGKFRLAANNFDQSGNLTPQAREHLARAQQDRARRLAQQAVAVRPRVEEPEDDDQGLLAVEFPGQRQLMALFSPVGDDRVVAAAGSQPVFTREVVAQLSSLSPEQLARVVPQVVAIPEVVSVGFDALMRPAPTLFGIAYQNTVRLVGDFSAEIITRFVDVQCDSHETLKFYVQWLHMNLLPTIQHLLLQQKKLAEQKFEVAKQSKLKSIGQQEQRLVLALQTLELETSRELNRRTFLGTGMLALPVLVRSAFPGEADTQVRRIFYAAFAGLTMLNLYKVVNRLDKSSRDRAQLAMRADSARALKSAASRVVVPAASVSAFDENMGRFVRETFETIEIFAKNESRRIQAGIDALQAQEERMPVASLAQVAVASPPPAAKSVVVVPPPSAGSRVLRGLGLVFTGFEALAKVLR